MVTFLVTGILMYFTEFWRSKVLTWCVKTYSKDLTSADQDEALEWALQVDYLNLFIFLKHFGEH